VVEAIRGFGNRKMIFPDTWVIILLRCGSRIGTEWRDLACVQHHREHRRLSPGAKFTNFPVSKEFEPENGSLKTLSTAMIQECRVPECYKRIA
jgi:hypothetical protein